MSIDQTAPRKLRRVPLVLPATIAVLLGFGSIHAGWAQSATAVLGEGGPRDQRPAGRNKTSAPADDSQLTPKLKQEPLQRLEAGALLCKTEADLEQHVAAVTARLNGNDAAEPAGCHLIRAMTAVSVVQRHGPARTQVKVGDQLGWTDTMIRNP